MRIRSSIAAIGAAGVLLAGCSSTTATDHGVDHMSAMPMGSASASAMPMMGAGASPSAATAGAMADVMFAQMMIPHHEQAVEMADLALQNPDSSPALRDLATQIKNAQQPEIELMNGWLVEWGVPAMMDEDDAGHMGHGMDGMMTEEEMDELAKASGPAFDRLWLELMIRHHEGALDMADGVLASSQDPRVIELANAITSSQAAEIATMKEMLASSSS